MRTHGTQVHAPPPPDGGWGWVVVAAAFGTHLVSHGVLYSFGIIFIALQEKYGGEKATTAWIGSLATGFLFLSGLLAGVLTDKFGCRVVCIAGSLLSCLAYVLSSFATDVYTLYVTMGIMAGIGFGFMFLPSVVCVTQYFHTKRGTACCIALSGAAAGASVFNPLVLVLLENYGLQGTMLFLAGLLLQVSVFATLFRPLSTMRSKQFREEPAVQGTDDVLVTTKLLSDVNESNHKRTFESKFEQPLKSCNTDGHMFSASRRLFLKANGNPDLKLSQLGHSADVLHKNGSGEDSVDVYKGRALRRQSSAPNVFSLDDHGSSPTHQHRPMAFNSFVLYSQPNLTGSCISIAFSASKESGANFDKQEDAERHKGTWLFIFRDQLSLFKDKMFVIFSISQATLHLGAYTPFIYIPDKALQAGINGHILGLFVAIMGFSSVVGRVIFGFIADRPGVNRVHLFSVALLISGVSTAFSFLYTSVYTLIAYVIIYGGFIGVSISLISVVLVDLIGLARLPRAFGINTLIDGVFCLIGPVVGGWLVDLTGNYDLTFLVMGAIMALGAILMHVTECCRERKVSYTSEVQEVKI